jgi:hypothetical protein
MTEMTIRKFVYANHSDCLRYTLADYATIPATHIHQRQNTSDTEYYYYYGYDDDNDIENDDSSANSTSDNDASYYYYYYYSSSSSSYSSKKRRIYVRVWTYNNSLNYREYSLNDTTDD